MGIWFQPWSLEEVNQRGLAFANGHMGIELTEVGPDYVQGRMPVETRTMQPSGILHGGASVLLAETLASVAARYVVDHRRFVCVGQEINANHVRSVRSGWVIGVARPLHLGRTSQVWDVRISDEQARLVCVSRVTMAVLARPSASDSAT